MLRALRTRARQGRRTIAFPPLDDPLPDRYRGFPSLDSGRCADGCAACAQACPTGAIADGNVPEIDLGRCLFCTDCIEACPQDAIEFTREYRLAASTRDALRIAPTAPAALPGVQALSAEMRRLFGRSLHLRQVSAGGCNACEADVAVLNTIVFDLGRFGIQFVASPRHADGILVTGPVTNNMREALQMTLEAAPEPRLVIAVGACAISGGPYIGHPEAAGGADSIVPVDLYIPGCPPHPLTILDGLLRLLGRLPSP